jgi:hypothetical protein
MKVNGQTLLREKCKELKIDLTALIAQTSIWANPEVIRELRKDNENPNALWVKNCRRLKTTETRREFGTDGCFLDNNTLANKAIKMATGEITEQGTFTACHIYEDSCYNKNFHTSICNLVLIPKEIYSLTDNDSKVIAALKYRSFELYGFFVSEQPAKPIDYDNIKWRSPELFSDKIKKSIKNRKRVEFICP